MNCANHPEVPASAFCRTCGKALCAECRRTSGGIVYCEEHVAPSSYAPPAAGPMPGAEPGAAPGVAPALPHRASPKLAFLLGLIPGVGAIYNEQYAKGLVHALLFGLLITIMDSSLSGGLRALFGIAIPAYLFYMAFEAYHTAQRRNFGIPVDEFSGVFEDAAHSSTGGAITMIVLGVVFLLNTLNIIRIGQLLKFWPVLLIALGVSMLYSRVTEKPNGRSGASNRMPDSSRQEANR
jgi:TM2 domain-containing membrane protein YozV